MHCSFSPAHWLVFDANGLIVDGQHSEAPLPIHPRLQADFDTLWPSNRARILASPAGFEGACAALLDWNHLPASQGENPSRLSIKTGFRPYTHSNTLKRLMSTPNSCVSTTNRAPSPDIQPDRLLTWGSSLTTLVLLDKHTILIGQRSENVDANPGAWTCVFTEIIEPTDIMPGTMDRLLARLVQEELPAFEGLGAHCFVGLVLIPRSYTWTLVSVLDLREVPRAHIDMLVAGLVPDAETIAWRTIDLNGNFDDVSFSGQQLQGLDLARDVSARFQELRYVSA